MTKKLFAFLFILLAFSNINCSLYKSIVNVSRLKFKLGAVNNLELCSIPIEGKNSLKDFSALDLYKFTASVAGKTMPVSFLLNVEANNPNDGTGGYARTDLTLTHFYWKLFIDDKETVSGDIDHPVSIPGTGENTVIPIRINLDLIKFFGDRGLESLVNLASSIAGKKGSSSNIVLYARPAISSPLGEIQYPEEIKIVSKRFTN